MDQAADRADHGMSGQERDVMVAAILGMTPERLRAIRRLDTKRLQAAPAVGARGAGKDGARMPRWKCVDQLDDDSLFMAFRRREARSRATGRAGVLPPVDPGRRRRLAQR